MLRNALLFFVAITALVGLLLFSQWESGPLRVSGFIEADDIRVGSRVGGRVERVEIVEGQRVEVGDVLLLLEPFDLLQQREAAEAELAERLAEYQRLQAGFRPEEVAEAKARVDRAAALLKKLVNGPRPAEIRAARKDVEEAGARLELAEVEYKRVETLRAQGATTAEALDRAASEYKSASAVLEARQAELDLLEEGTRVEEIEEARAQLAEAEEAWKLRRNGFRREDIEKAKAAVDAARARLQALEERIEELTVRAPVDAVVEAVDLEPGDLVGANVPAISLLDYDRLWVRAYVPEDALDIETGQKVTVTVDSYPGEQFAAHVSFVARQAEFTPRNVQTPEERSKQVFRIKVILDEGLDRLRPGMAADVWFEEDPE